MRQITFYFQDANDTTYSFQNGHHNTDDQLPPLTVAQVKLEPTKSCIVGCVARERDSLADDAVKEETFLPDTIEAHLELVREREAKIKMKDEIPDQVRRRQSQSMELFSRRR